MQRYARRQNPPAATAGREAVRDTAAAPAAPSASARRRLKGSADSVCDSLPEAATRVVSRRERCTTCRGSAIRRRVNASFVWTGPNMIWGLRHAARSCYRIIYLRIYQRRWLAYPGGQGGLTHRHAAGLSEGLHLDQRCE